MNNRNYEANAKLNLFLIIEKKNNNGYHNINSLFLEINFFDNITFKPAKQYKLSIKGYSVPNNETNLIYKSYHLLQQRFKNTTQNYAIKLNKKIPLYSGLGGGSSNAATVLKALNKLWNLKQNNKQLEMLAEKIGADVPFFINGGLQHVTGIGNKLKRLKLPKQKNIFLLVCPKIQISTKWAYENTNKYLQINKKEHKFNASFKSFNWLQYENDFEELVISTYPKIGKIKKKLIESGAFFTSLSGSGSTMFGVFENIKNAQKAILNFPTYHTILTFPKNKLP